MSYLKYSIHETLLIICVIINTVTITIIHNPTVVPNPSVSHLDAVATTEILFLLHHQIISYKL